MGMPEYRQMLEMLCHEAGIPDVDDALLHGRITIRGIPVWIQYFEPADLCRIVVDLGAPQNGIPASVFRVMLECNCSSESVSLPFLAINPANGHAILILHLSVPMLCRDGSILKLLEEQLSDVTRIWREFFEFAQSLDPTKKSFFHELNHA